MPNGPTHDKIALLGAVVGAPIVAVIADRAGYSNAQALAAALTWSACHAWSGLLCSPDLDLDASIDNRWGLLRILWYPYRQIVPHRHWLSHGLIVGALARLLYLVFWFCLVVQVGLWTCMALDIPATWSSLGAAQSLYQGAVSYPHVSLAALAGFVSASDMHITADTISTFLKRRATRRRKDNVWQRAVRRKKTHRSSHAWL